MENWLIEGLTATVSGVATVFIVLILIAFLISQLKHLNKLGRKRDNNTAARNTIEATSTAHLPRVIKPEEMMDDLDLVAVITGAVAASMNTSTDKLIVRSIRRVDSGRRRR